MASKDFAKNLQKLENSILKLATQAMDFSMTWAENEAKRTTVFVDRTGRLRNSINGGIARVTGTVVEGGVGAGQNDASGDLAATMSYAPRIELGFTGADSLGRQYNQMPRPFIWPAVMAVRNQEILPRALKGLMQSWRP